MVDVYRYSDELLKRMPKENLTAMVKTLLYSTEKDILIKRREPKANNVANAVKRIEKFQDQLKHDPIYRIPLNL